MGLTIHYTITAPGPSTATAAQRIVTDAHAAIDRLTRRHHHGVCTPVEAVDPDAPWFQASIFRRVDAHTSQGFSVPPLRGSCFTLTPGEDCEPACFGLCEYPATLRLPDGRRLRTGLGGWRLQVACKTQYAGLHGWEHFHACHRLVIDAVLVWKKLGCAVRITDEGDYWPGRDTQALRAQLDRYNRIVAGLGGALKDATAPRKGAVG